MPLLWALAAAASVAPFLAPGEGAGAPLDDRSLVEHVYCSTAVLRNASAPPFDFDCLRNASSHLGSAVRVLAPPGAARTAKACAKLCAGAAYRGLPCRAYTWFSSAAAGACRRAGGLRSVSSAQGPGRPRALYRALAYLWP